MKLNENLFQDDVLIITSPDDDISVIDEEPFDDEQVLSSSELTATASITELIKSSFDFSQQLSASITLINDSGEDELIPVLHDVEELQKEIITKLQQSLGSCQDKVTPCDDICCDTTCADINNCDESIDKDHNDAKQFNESFQKFLQTPINFRTVEYTTEKQQTGLGSDVLQESESSLKDTLYQLWE